MPVIPNGGGSGGGAGPMGPQGRNGETPQFQTAGNVLQYRFESDTPTAQMPSAWTDLYEFPDSMYIHTQSIAAAVWTVPHNFGEQFVGVRVNDFAGNELLPEIIYTSANIVTLKFVAPVQGTAKINT